MNTNNEVPHITYFDVRGRAEVIRLILEDTGTAYTERRVTVAEWPELKPTLAFGQLPLYEEGDLLLNQSHAIYRHLARKHDLYGDSDLDKLRCDIVQETFVDAQTAIGGLFWRPDFEAVRDDFEANDLPQLLERLQKLLLNNTASNSYWVGNRISYADFIAWHTLDYVRPFSQKTLNQFPALCEFKALFESRPRIADYLGSERRPKTLTVSLCPFGGTPETS